MTEGIDTEITGTQENSAGTAQASGTPLILRAVTPGTLCKSLKRNGEPCRTLALSDGYCFAHSPALEAKRREGRLKGGAGSAKVARLQKLMPPRLGPVNTMLENILKELYDHKMDARTAQAIAAVARTLVTVFTTGEMEGRLLKLEAKEESNGDR